MYRSRQSYAVLVVERPMLFQVERVASGQFHCFPLTYPSPTLTAQYLASQDYRCDQCSRAVSFLRELASRRCQKRYQGGSRTLGFASLRGG